VGDRSAIEWCDASWNPITGCSKVSPGCAHCYAATLAPRLSRMGQRGYTELPWTPENAAANVFLHEDRLAMPVRWTRPRRIFVNSMSDLFHELVPDEFIARVFATMALAPQHTFQVLTKRPERMREWVTKVAYSEHGWLTHNGDNPRGWQSSIPGEKNGTGVVIEDGRTLQPNGDTRDGKPVVKMTGEPRWPLPNVWLGTSVENQTWADRRIPDLVATPAAVRFLSCEPLLGPVDFADVTRRSDAAAQWGRKALDGIGWVIVGGESGPVHRPVDPAWVRSIRDQCAEAGVPFLFKQWGGRTSKSGGRELDGRTHDGYPDA
jgi:protein gp37